MPVKKEGKSAGTTKGKAAAKKKVATKKKAVKKHKISKHFKNEEFIDSISHPRKKDLAARLLGGETEETLLEQFGNTRIAEMQKIIAFAQENPEKYYRQNNTICLTCSK